MNIDEHLDQAFRQADAFREKAKVLGQEVERNPARTAARAREVIPVVMEQNRYHAAQIGGVDVASPDWSRAPAWKERAARERKPRTSEAGGSSNMPERRTDRTPREAGMDELVIPSGGKIPRRERLRRATVARPADWIGQTVIMGTDMHGDDTVGTLEEVNDRGVVVRHGIVEVESEVVEFEADPEGEVVEIEAEVEGEPERQSIFYPWAKVNWMYHPGE